MDLFRTARKPLVPLVLSFTVLLINRLRGKNLSFQKLRSLIETEPMADPFSSSIGEDSSGDSATTF